MYFYRACCAASGALILLRLFPFPLLICRKDSLGDGMSSTHFSRAYDRLMSLRRLALHDVGGTVDIHWRFGLARGAERRGMAGGCRGEGTEGGE